MFIAQTYCTFSVCLILLEYLSLSLLTLFNENMYMGWKTHRCYIDIVHMEHSYFSLVISSELFLVKYYKKEEMGRL